MVNVQFLDASQQVVISYFADAQDPAVYPNQGSIDQTDARYAAFFNSLPAFAQADLPVP